MSLKEYSSMVDRRSELRVPVHFSMQIDLEDRRTGLFYRTYLINYSGGGICVAWDLCQNCQGYSPGKVHPDCIFSLYDADRGDSNELTIYVHIPGTETMMTVKGKVVYTYKDNGIEQIGIAFTEMPGRLIPVLDEMCYDL